MQDVRRWRQIRTRRQSREQSRTVGVLLKKHMPNTDDGFSRSRTTWPDAVDADIDVPAVCISPAQPALKPRSHRALDRHDTLGGLARSIVLEEHGDPIGRLERSPQKAT